MSTETALELEDRDVVPSELLDVLEGHLVNLAVCKVQVLAHLSFPPES
ncbi:hypothetical protein [Streptomyces californicus]